MTVIKNITLLVFTAMLGVFVLGGTSLYLAGEINTSASYANVNTVPSLLEIDRAAAARWQAWFAALLDPAGQRHQGAQRRHFFTADELVARHLQVGLALAGHGFRAHTGRKNARDHQGHPRLCPTVCQQQGEFDADEFQTRHQRRSHAAQCQHAEVGPCSSRHCCQRQHPPIEATQHHHAHQEALFAVADRKPHQGRHAPQQGYGHGALGDTTGMVKFLADATTDEILGVHMVGPQVSELIAEAVVAMEFRASAEDIARICHAHPSLSESTKEAALAVDKRTLNF